MFIQMGFSERKLNRKGIAIIIFISSTSCLYKKRSMNLERNAIMIQSDLGNLLCFIMNKNSTTRYRHIFCKFQHHFWRQEFSHFLHALDKHDKCWHKTNMTNRNRSHFLLLSTVYPNELRKWIAFF
jgi:hypothetical protein